MVTSIYDIKECPDCASMELVYNERKQQVVCKSCSLIYEPLVPVDEAIYLRSTIKEQAKPVKKAKKSRSSRSK
ncbi:MAG TPA: hypothetical protein VJK72_04600 [Candidatus Nanoarchaeia archaeon]|nr:hypothetical protein [Candidatus Nanoarchaeia archaeon]